VPIQIDDKNHVRTPWIGGKDDPMTPVALAESLPVCLSLIRSHPSYVQICRCDSPTQAGGVSIQSVSA